MRVSPRSKKCAFLGGTKPGTQESTQKTSPGGSLGFISIWWGPDLHTSETGRVGYDPISVHTEIAFRAKRLRLRCTIQYIRFFW
jgi:hypothetical protein